MGSIPFLPFLSTLNSDTIEQNAHLLMVHLHATLLTVPTHTPASFKEFQAYMDF
jgi:hypothetical protein